MRKHHSVILVASLALGGLSGCASSDDKPDSCKGVRRPANPYGSVLQPGAPSDAQTPGQSLIPGSPDPAAPPKPLPDQSGATGPHGSVCP